MKEKETENKAEGSGPMCDECQEKAKLRRKAEAEGVQAEGASNHVDDVLSSPGRPLDRSVREFMEPRFGHDFSRIRIHTDHRADDSARAVNAFAYTVGSNIVFSNGRYAPETTEGRSLLAHELTHVIQQDGGDAKSQTSRISRKADPGKAEPICAELDSWLTLNSNLVKYWSALGSDLPDATEDGAVVTKTPNSKTNKLESFKELWERSLKEGMSEADAGQPVVSAFANDTIRLAKGYVSGNQVNLSKVVEDLKKAKDQKVSPPAANSSQVGGVEDSAKQISRSTVGKPIADAGHLVDTATVLHFLRSWEELLKGSAVGMRRPPTTLLPTPGPVPSAGGFNPLPGAPAPDASSSPGTAAAPQSGDPISFGSLFPEPTVDKALGTPGLESFDAPAFDAILKTYRDCEARKGDFDKLAMRLMQEDANLAALANAPGDLLKQVSALGNQTEAVATDVMIRIAETNAKAAATFLAMLDSGDAKWQMLGPVKNHLLGGGDGGSRSWKDEKANKFIAAYFKQKKEQDETKAMLEAALAVGIAVGTLAAILSPAAPLAIAFMTAVDLYGVGAAAGSINEANLAAKDANVKAAGADAGVIDKDDAKRAKDEADAKQVSMVIDVITAALPYLGAAAKGGVRIAGAVGRDLRWANMARAAEAAKEAEGMRGALKAEEHVLDKTAREITGIPDAKGEGTHKLQYGAHGPERCTHCEIFGRSLSERSKFLQTTVGGKAPRVSARAMYIQAVGDSIAARAAEIAKLSKEARAIQESALLREAYGLELQMVEIEHEALGISSDYLPAAHKGRWSDELNPGSGRWFPNKEHAAYKYCGDKGIPYSGGYPNFSELALPGGEVNLMPGRKIVVDGVEMDQAMVGKMSDFEIADTLAAQMTGKTPGAFRDWRLGNGLTWHHRENGVTMQLVWTELHASIPHLGGAGLQRGIPVP